MFSLLPYYLFVFLFVGRWKGLGGSPVWCFLKTDLAAISLEAAGMPKSKTGKKLD